MTTFFRSCRGLFRMQGMNNRNFFLGDKCHWGKL
jgi:hypothetical protein